MPTSRDASLAREAAKKASQIPRAERFPLAKAAPAAQPVPAIEDVRRKPPDDWGVPPDERKLKPSQTYQGKIVTIAGSPPKMFIRPDYDWFAPGKQLDVIADLSCFSDYTGENQGARIGTYVNFTLSPDEPQWSQTRQADRFTSYWVWTGDPNPLDDPASRKSPTPEPDKKDPGKKKKDVDEKKKLKNADRKKVGSGKKDVGRKKKEDVDGKELGIRKRIAKIRGRLGRGTAGKKKLATGKRIHKEPSVERGSERGSVERSVDRSTKSKRKRKRTPSPEEEEEADSDSVSSESEEQPETRRRRTKVPPGRRPRPRSPRRD